MKLDVDVDACNAVVKDGEIPEKWSRSWMTNVYKGKVLHRLVVHTLHYIIVISHALYTPKRSVVLQRSYICMRGSVCQ